MTTTISSPIHWGWLFFLGLMLILGGVFAIAAPFYAVGISFRILGWLLVFGGAVQIIYALSTIRLGSFLLHFLLGTICVLLGILVITQAIPMAGLFTMILAFFFLVVGIFRIFSALVQKFENWGWVLTVGIAEVILGLLVLFYGPLFGIFIFGIFIGIDFIFIGWALITSAWLVKNEVVIVK